MGLAHEDRAELLDGDQWTHRDLGGNFRDIEHVNRYLGGASLTIRGIERLTGPDSRPFNVQGSTFNDRVLSLLDVGTGSADIPNAICRWARKTGREVSIVATDVNAEILGLAVSPDFPEIKLEVADARRLPYPDCSFDVVTSSLLVHHLSPPDANVALREMARVSRLGVVVNDLVRNRLAHVFAVVLAGIATRNRLSRNDGPLSVRRAYALAELLDLTRASGLSIVRVEQKVLYRVAVTARSRSVPGVP